MSTAVVKPTANDRDESFMLHPAFQYKVKLTFDNGKPDSPHDDRNPVRDGGFVVSDIREGMQIKKLTSVMVTAATVTGALSLCGCATQQQNVNNKVVNPQQTTSTAHRAFSGKPLGVKAQIPLEIITPNFRVILAPSLLESGLFNMLTYYVGKSPIQNNLSFEFNGATSVIKGNSMVYPGTMIGDDAGISLPSHLDSLQMKIRWTVYGSGKQESESIPFTKARHDLFVEEKRFYQGHSEDWSMVYGYEKIGNKSFQTGAFGDVILRPNAGVMTIHSMLRYTVQWTTGKFTLNGPTGMLTSWSNSFNSAEPQFVIHSPRAKVSVFWNGKTEHFSLDEIP